MSNKIEAEYLDIVNRSAWSTVYQKIRQTCEKYEYKYDEAKKPKNTSLNRYMDVSPFDHSRVVLQRGTQDYINANIVKMERANRRYILTQGPLPATAGHFWLMIWEQNCRAILMLNKLIEKDQVKCHWYWPCDIGPQYVMAFTDVGLKVEQLSSEDHSYFSTRIFKLTDVTSDTSREILHFHYTTWPDFGVPSSPHAFLEFLYKVRGSGCLDPSVGPAVVHCSAGIGRSGTFCLVDSCLVLIEKDGVDNVNLQEILLEMRRDRMGLIQTPDQLRFSYQAIIEGIKRLDPEHQAPNWEEQETPVEEDGPPPPPPKRGESLRKTPTGPLPVIPSSESAGELVGYANKSNNGKTEVVSNGYSNDTDSTFVPPTKELPNVPTSDSDDSESNSEDESEPPVDRSSDGLRKRSMKQAALKERLQQIKRKQQKAERWHSIKRSLYKPMAFTFGLIICGAIVYIYIKH